MKFADLIFAARPILHIPFWTVYLISFHYHQVLSGRTFDWQHMVIIAAISMALAGGYYLNQVFDVKSDTINDKAGFLQKGLVSERTMICGYVALSAVSLVLTALVSVALLIITAQIVFLAYVYSAPPLRLKDRPFWGIFANAYVFGFLAVFTIMPDASIHTLGLLGWDNPFYFFCAVASITILTTIPDREGDAATNKRTIAVVLGPRASLSVAFLLMGLAAGIAYLSEFALLFYLAVIAALIILGALMLYSPSVVLVATKLPVLMMAVLAGFFYPLYLLFLVALVLATRIYYLRRFGIIYPSLA